MKRLALLLGPVICAVAVSTAYATTRGDDGSPPPHAQPEQVLIESQPGVYIDAPRSSAQETTSAATARPASREPSASPDEMPLVRPGGVLIESEPGVYVAAPAAVRGH